MENPQHKGSRLYSQISDNVQAHYSDQNHPVESHLFMLIPVHPLSSDRQSPIERDDTLINRLFH